MMFYFVCIKHFYSIADKSFWLNSFLLFIKSNKYKIKDESIGNFYAFRSHGKPCSCFLCRNSKYNRANEKLNLFKFIASETLDLTQRGFGGCKGRFVVICFQIIWYLRSYTTHLLVSGSWNMLWFAFKLFGTLDLTQRSCCSNTLTGSCDLLSNYLVP